MSALSGLKRSDRHADVAAFFCSALRADRRLRAEDKLRRWKARVRWQEMNERDRRLRYFQMQEAERRMLGEAQQNFKLTWIL